MLSLPDRCQAKHCYEGAERQCRKPWAHRITDTQTGDSYRVCTQHARMASEGKIGPFAKCVRSYDTQHWRRHGTTSPYINRYRVALNTKEDEKDNG